MVFLTPRDKDDDPVIETALRTTDVTLIAILRNQDQE